MTAELSIGVHIDFDNPWTSGLPHDVGMADTPPLDRNQPAPATGISAMDIDPVVLRIILRLREEVAEATARAYQELVDAGFDPDEVLLRHPIRSHRAGSRPTDPQG